jgi:hypothetical protein
MRGRLLIPTATSIAAVACAFTALAATTVPDGQIPAAARVFLTCSGAMSTSSLPGPADAESRIVANGVVDLENLRVAGFGIGSEPIVSLTSRIVSFGTAAAPGHEGTVVRVTDRSPTTVGPQGTVVEGIYDRTSGATTIIVRSAADRGNVVLAMTLDCTSSPAPR